jgi:hypothetical protein
MKRIVLLIPFLLITGIAFSQSECEKFRIGKFQNLENGIVKSKIERTDSIQIEQDGKIIIKLKIEWIDECSYRLIFLEGNDDWWESRGRDSPTPDLIVRITAVNENSYLQEAKFADDEEFKYKSSIEKIE